MNKPNYRDCPKSNRCKYLNNCPHDYRPCTPFYSCFVKGKVVFKSQENTEYVVSRMSGADTERIKEIHDKAIRDFVKKLKEKSVWDDRGDTKIVYEYDIDKLFREEVQTNEIYDVK